MSIILITTPQNIDLEYELGSVGDRIVAGLIDYAIIIVYLIIVSLAFALNKFGGSASQILLFLFYLPIFFYTLLSELLMNGQTVGKNVMKIKVISLNGNQASFSQYLTRWLFRVIDIWMTSYLLAIIMIAVSEKRQRLGDIVAHTTLIKTTARTTINHTLYAPVAETNYQTTYPAVIYLKNSDIQLLKEVLLNIQKSGNTMLALQAMRKIETTLNIKSQHEPITFLYAVLSDYNHLAIKI
ncbi:MAG: RDD family protein [Pedobacter sp.]|nr:RDD family protein [Chitinophagaceae bacterium]